MQDKMENILRTVLKVQTSMFSNNDEINDAIAEIRREIGMNSGKVLSN